MKIAADELRTISFDLLSECVNKVQLKTGNKEKFTDLVLNTVHVCLNALACSVEVISYGLHTNQLSDGPHFDDELAVALLRPVVSQWLHYALSREIVVLKASGSQMIIASAQEELQVRISCVRLC